MPEEWISLTHAARLLGYRDSATLRLAAKAGTLRVERLRSGERVATYMTKESWVRAWDEARPRRGESAAWPRGKEREKRKPRRPASEEQPQ